MTSEWRHVPQISTENKGLRESPPRVQFKSYNQLSYTSWRKISGATKLLSRIFKILKITQNFQIFQHFVFLCKIFPLKIKNFQNTVQYVRGQWLINMCTKFQVDIFKNGWDITWNVSKTGTFRVISGLYRDFPIFFLTDFDASKSVLGSFFRVLCENLT